MVEQVQMTNENDSLTIQDSINLLRDNNQHVYADNLEEHVNALISEGNTAQQRVGHLEVQVQNLQNQLQQAQAQAQARQPQGQRNLDNLSDADVARVVQGHVAKLVVA